ncbi:hypothetical protein LINPERHAP1_LOCUS7357 [Linum perenne]
MVAAGATTTSPPSQVTSNGNGRQRSGEERRSTISESIKGQCNCIQSSIPQRCSEKLDGRTEAIRGQPRERERLLLCKAERHYYSARVHALKAYPVCLVNLVTMLANCNGLNQSKAVTVGTLVLGMLTTVLSVLYLKILYASDNDGKAIAEAQAMVASFVHQQKEEEEAAKVVSLTDSQK